MRGVPVSRVTINGREYDGDTRVGFAMTNVLHRQAGYGHWAFCNGGEITDSPDLNAATEDGIQRPAACSRCFPPARTDPMGT